MYAYGFLDDEETSGYYYKSAIVNGEMSWSYGFAVTADINWGGSMNIYDANGDLLDSDKYEVAIWDKNFNEMTEFIYDGTDIYDPADDNNTVVGTDFFVVVRLKEAVDFYIAIF
jgi:hypothetical protein